MYKKIYFSLLCCVASACFITLSADDLPAEHLPLAPTEEMGDQTRWLVNTINARHYLRETVGELDGVEMIEAYAGNFDYNRMIFLQDDISELSFRFADAMEAFLKRGNLYAAFEIYNRFSESIEARTQWILSRLEEPFDFSQDAYFNADRKDAEWPADKAEADTLWDKRLTYELLNEILSAASKGNEEEMNKSNPEMPAPAYKSSQDEDKDLFDAEQLSQLLDSPEFHEATFAEAKETIRRRYERRRSIMRQREAADIQEAYINAMTQLFDPHSKFLSADTLEGFNVSVQNSFVGIGAMLQDEDGICVIKDILPGGPAEASQQLNSGDEILGVGQGKEGEFIDVVDVQLRFIVRKIKGKKGTFVRLLIRPANASDPSDRKEVTIARGEVKLTANLAAAELIQIPNDENGTTLVGVIELPSFYGNIGLGDTLTTASDDISELLKKLTDAGAQGIVLDLRNNGGGLLSEAIHVTGLFIPTGPVVLVRDKSGHTEIQLDLNPKILWDGPLIVLTSRFSASASEIVAGALQDHKRAIVIGNSSTHGKGTVQEVYNMNSRPIFSFIPQISKPAGARPVASKITIKQFYLPSGRSTQLKGVPSDIVLPSSNEFLPIGESDLPHALPWDQVQNALRGRPTLPAKITNTNDLEQIESLRQASKARQDTMQEFEFLKKQIAWRKERYEKTMVSLNLAKRIEEKIEDEAYIKEFKEAREILYESNYPTEKFLTKISEEQEAISLKNKLSIEGDDAADEEEEPNLDIYLRETARIMADWIHALEAPQGKRVAETAELLSTK